MQIVYLGNPINNHKGARETMGQKEKLDSSSVSTRDPLGSFEPGMPLQHYPRNEIGG